MFLNNLSFLFLFFHLFIYRIKYVRICLFCYKIENGKHIARFFFVSTAPYYIYKIKCNVNTKCFSLKCACKHVWFIKKKNLLPKFL